MIKRLLTSLAYPLGLAVLYFAGLGIAHVVTPHDQWVMAIGFGALIAGAAVLLAGARVALITWVRWVRNG